MEKPGRLPRMITVFDVNVEYTLEIAADDEVEAIKNGIKMVDNLPIRAKGMSIKARALGLTRKVSEEE